MNPPPDSTLADPQQIIADLRRELAERIAERDEALAREREALEQQTATAEVLRVINSSPGDLAPVFDAMLEKEMARCGAAYGQIATYDGRLFQFVAVRAEPGLVAQHPREPLAPQAGITWPKLVKGQPFVHISDLSDTDLYRSGHEGARGLVEVGGCRTMLTVALRRDEALVGSTSSLSAGDATIL